MITKKYASISEIGFPIKSILKPLERKSLIRQRGSEVKYQDAHKSVEQITEDRAEKFWKVLTFRGSIFNY